VSSTAKEVDAMPDELSPKTEAIIGELIAGGAYPDRAAWIDEAVTRLGLTRHQLRDAIQAGIDSGPSIPGDIVFADLYRRIDEIERQSRKRHGQQSSSSCALSHKPRP
jgi:hypothetical protein